jgi:hypothetical protein
MVVTHPSALRTEIATYRPRRIPSVPTIPKNTAEGCLRGFKTDKAEFDRLHAMDAARAKSAKESKAAWKGKNMSRPEKQERAQAKQAADTKLQETMDAIKDFNEAREADKSRG